MGERRSRASLEGEWPAASVVTRLFGTWSAARAVAAERAGEIDEGAGVGVRVIWQGIDLPAETPGIHRNNPRI